MFEPRSTRRAIDFGRMVAGNAGDVLKGMVTGRDGGGLVPGHSRARAIVSDQILPDKVDVVVVGGGYIGCATALELAERGVRVALCEKGVIAGESSGRSLGLIEGQLLDPAKVEIVTRAKQLWEGMNARIGGETGYRRSGFTALIGDQGFLGFAEQWLQSMNGVPGIDATLLTAAQAQAVAKGGAGRYLGGLYQASDGGAEPELAAPAIAEGVRKAGGLVFQHCAVRGIDTRGGAVCGVVTESGTIACDAVVIAGGAWSPIFLRSLGIDLPQFMAFSSVARVAPGAPLDMPVLEGNHGLVIRRTLDGSFDVCKPRASAPITPDLIANMTSLGPAMQHLGDQIQPVWNFATFRAQWKIPRQWPLDRPSPFEATRILQPETRQSLLADVMTSSAAAFPAIGHAAVTDRWAGILTSTPDNMPVISAIDRVPGLFVGSGFYFGLTMAPAAGEALADLVTGNAPRIDLSLYRHGRFSDGSPLQFRA